MKEKRTQAAIAAFYHGAALEKNWLPADLQTVSYPAWVKKLIPAGKGDLVKFRSVLDLLSEKNTTAPVNKGTEPEQIGIPDGDAETYLENLLLWGKENLDALPSADPYVSRYEAGRLAAALACIQLDTVDPASAQPMTLLAGDLSGVQDFIYTITNKGAVSALRGRSLYLQLLTEAIARYSLDFLELPISNLLYMGGGQFLILAGKTEKLDALRKEISQTLLRHHKGALSLTLAETPLSVNELQGKALTDKRKALYDDLQERKKRRFSELGTDLATLFTPKEHGGNIEQQCSVCGGEDQRVKPEKDNPDIRKCPACLSYEKIGDKLRKAEYLVWQKATSNKDDQGYEKVLHAFGWDAQFYEEGELPAPNAARKEIVLAINDEALKKLTPSKHRAVGRRYLVNVTPVMSADEAKIYEPEEGERKAQAGDIKPFDMLAKQAKGIQRLGVLRMDVDNLGRLFEDGLGKDVSLARLNALSGQISKFFEGEVERIAKEVDAARLYSIYSGGDDLFFVGAWDAVVELAVKIREEMDIFSGNNPKFHASAGIVLISNKYPLAQGAQAAGAAEKKSKLLPGKNAVTFLGETFDWERFSAKTNSVLSTKTTLSNLLEKGAGHAPVHQLLRLYAQYKDSLRKRREKKGDTTNESGTPQVHWGRWMWLGYYYLKRNNSEEIRKLGDQLKENGDFGAMDKLGVAARWAMLLNRKKAVKE